MKKLLVGIPAVALALTVGGFVVANSQMRNDASVEAARDEAAFVCPMTGEELPCPQCCPLNESQSP